MIKKTKNTLFVSVSVIALALFASVSYLYFHKNKNIYVNDSNDSLESGLTKVEGYVDHGTCAALSPECGLCYGQIIDKECYVEKSKLTPEELHYMGFK